MEENRLVIDFQIEGQRLRQKGNTFIVEKSQQILYAKFNFDELYNNTIKKAYFKNKENDIPTIMQIVDNECEIPNQNINAPIMYMWLECSNDLKIITTNKVEILIRETGELSGTIPIAPTKSLLDSLFNNFSFSYDKILGKLTLSLIDVGGKENTQEVEIFTDTDRYIVNVDYDGQKFIFTYNDGTYITCPFLIDLTEYQKKNDDSLNTTSKNIVEAINELNTNKVNKNDIYSNTQIDTKFNEINTSINNNVSEINDSINEIKDDLNSLEKLSKSYDTSSGKVKSEIKLSNSGFSLKGQTTKPDETIVINELKTSNSKMTINAADLQINSAKNLDIRNTNITGRSTMCIGDHFQIYPGNNTTSNHPFFQYSQGSHTLTISGGWNMQTEEPYLYLSHIEVGDTIDIKSYDKFNISANSTLDVISDKKIHLNAQDIEISHIYNDINNHDIPNHSVGMIMGINKFALGVSQGYGTDFDNLFSGIRIEYNKLDITTPGLFRIHKYDDYELLKIDENDSLIINGANTVDDWRTSKFNKDGSFNLADAIKYDGSVATFSAVNNFENEAYFSDMSVYYTNTIVEIDNKSTITIDGEEVATKKYVDEHSGGGGSDEKTNVDFTITSTPYGIEILKNNLTITKDSKFIYMNGSIEVTGATSEKTYPIINLPSNINVKYTYCQIYFKRYTKSNGSTYSNYAPLNSNNKYNSSGTTDIEIQKNQLFIDDKFNVTNSHNTTYYFNNAIPYTDERE